MRIHRVCVAVGSLERAEVETGTRALRVDPRVLNDATPFTVGATDRARGWVRRLPEPSDCTDWTDSMRCTAA